MLLKKIVGGQCTDAQRFHSRAAAKHPINSSNEATAIDDTVGEPARRGDPTISSALGYCRLDRVTRSAFSVRVHGPSIRRTPHHRRGTPVRARPSFPALHLQPRAPATNDK